MRIEGKTNVEIGAVFIFEDAQIEVFEKGRFRLDNINDL